MVVHLLRHAFKLPPREAARRAVRFAARLARQHLGSRVERSRCSYADAGGIRLGRRIAALDRTALEPCRAALAELVPRYLDHRFDLLGSGWVRVAHGERYAGFGKWRYGPHPTLPPEWRDAVAAEAWPANRARARALLALIPDGYRPIDWQVDFKSGWRWSPLTWGPGSPYAHRPGIDIKVPWELARLQHLAPLALAYGLDGDPRLPVEFRAQVLDFLAANPPGWGVNWACAMDVAIRAANILVARDLFLAAGACFDDAFEAELAAAMLAHGRFILRHLEWSETRGNHYLADICGLLVIASYLPGAEAAGWRTLAITAVAEEVPRQFLPDGGNFEASTCYHRLSAEMALYAVAMAPDAFPREVFERLALAARFTADVTMPSGRVAQVGDNDSGRFLKLAPLADLDHSGLLAAANGLLGTAFPVSPMAAVEGMVIAALGMAPSPATGGGGQGGGPSEARECVHAHGRTPASLCSLGPHSTPPPVLPGEGVAARLRLVPLDPGALADLRPIAYPDFGLFIWKGPRAFVAVRCGAVGQMGQGGHAHNDQLVVEIEIDGIAWARDPGSFVYTADLDARDAYRSALAHFVPRHGNDEPARLLAPFRLEDRAQARVLCFGADEFVGSHVGFGRPVFRRVRIEAGAIVIEDSIGAGDFTITSPAELARLWGLTLPFSPGYGVCDKPDAP